MNGQSARPRCLIRLPNWIGDGVMAAPAVLGLGRAIPYWDLYLLGNSRTSPLYEGLDHPFRLLPPLPDDSSRPFGMARAALEMRRMSFSAALLLPPSFSSALMAALAGIPLRTGRRSEGRGWLLDNPLAPGVRTRHLRTQYAEAAAAVLDRLAPGESPWALSSETRRLPLRAGEIEWADRWFVKAGLDPMRTIFLAPGATYGFTKRWPLERFLVLGRGLVQEGWSLVMPGGRDEEVAAEGLAADLSSSAKGGAVAVSAAGRMTLRESMAVMARGRAAVCNDSGAMHLAQAAGCPVVGIFGSTSPQWTGPGGNSHRILYSGLPCSPCFSRECPTRIECLSTITPADVRLALDDLLETAASTTGRPAVFLDRDGTILELVPYLSSASQVRLLPGAGDALRRLRDAGFALVVATNQSAVARGLLDEDGLRSIHLRMEELLRNEGVHLDGIEFCPHHPDYTGRCACRKPLPGMLRRSAHSLDLDLGQSFMIGDNGPDVEAGRNAGVRTILVRTGYGREAEESPGATASPGDEPGAQSPKPDAVVDDLVSAADWILSRSGCRV